ncbi:DUF4352 domain-containing protein [Bacillus spizizenii]|uniref:zinc ribbon domain-containing protein n=1 Tax=Bacillus spizizenii TaxID=96241 RepID=UPI002281112F|nr:DUF4352 domain-containing protein [Bacillus spizizenii]MCY8062045.1 DUF4352 domain-containing protein [Bacillus spizizenii]MCY8134850.1 DUF4352 domain-containing protein [Bacillus spizizenii]MCY8257084.1 DUF4352 domain-containing protein [Bacillus spizizenii]MCY8332539.1 DUF4352 domain-containing protein [Bacillus spizizenii]
MSGKMQHCKTCGQEIAKGVKKCPNCGKDQRNFFMRHKIITFILAIVVIIIIANIGNSGDSQASTATTSSASKKSTKTVQKADMEKLYTNANQFKNYKVDLYVKVFDVEQDDDGTYLQGYNNPEKLSKNTLIMSDDSDLDIKDDDIIHVVGTVKDKYNGENALGGSVSAPRIIADSIEKSDYATAFAPAKKTINVDKTQNQHGFALTLQKVELAEKETRLYVKIENKSQDEISFYDFNAKIIADNKQLERKDDLSSYPKIQSEILPGVNTEGVIVFPKIESKTAKIILEGSSENYDITINPFTFEVNLDQ